MCTLFYGSSSGSGELDEGVVVAVASGELGELDGVAAVGSVVSVALEMELEGVVTAVASVVVSLLHPTGFLLHNQPHSLPRASSQASITPANVGTQ